MIAATLTPNSNNEWQVTIHGQQHHGRWQCRGNRKLILIDSIAAHCGIAEATLEKPPRHALLPENDNWKATINQGS